MNLLVEQAITNPDPNVDFEVRVRFKCANCGGRGGALSDSIKPWPMTCLACGGTGYLERWMRIDDLLDVLRWREKREVVKGGA